MISKIKRIFNNYDSIFKQISSTIVIWEIITNWIIDVMNNKDFFSPQTRREICLFWHFRKKKNKFQFPFLLGLALFLTIIFILLRDISIKT